eukprot:399810_1
MHIINIQSIHIIVYIQPTFINIQPIHITIQQIHHITPIINTRDLHILFSPIFSLLFYFIMSGTISKNGDENYYLTIDKFFSIDPVIYLQCALSHPLVSAHFRSLTFLYL